MPFENFDSNESNNKLQASEELDGSMPTARLVGLAGVTAGLTELTMNQIGNNTAKLFKESAEALVKNAYSGGPEFYNALDKLRTHQSTSIISDIKTTTGPLSAATSKEVGKVINQAIDVGHSLSAQARSTEAFMSAATKLKSEISLLSGEFDSLSAGFLKRADIKDVMHNDSIILRHSASKLQAPMTATELRAFGETSFNKGSLFGEGMIKKAASMGVGDKIAPAAVVDEIAPVWKQQLTSIIADDARFARVDAQLQALKAPSVQDMNGGLLKKMDFDKPLFNKGETITTAIDDFAAHRRYVTNVESTLALEQKLLNNTANGLSNKMRAELAAGSNAHAFVRGFAKGTVAMSAAVGAGYAFDKLMGRDELAISSPLGMGIDAAAGLTLLAPIPGAIKVPLAVAALATPRILDATGHGDFLKPSRLNGDSILRANAVDAIGLGLAAGLNVDGRIRLGIGAATIVAGRMYNAMNTRNENTIQEVDIRKFVK